MKQGTKEKKPKSIGKIIIIILLLLVIGFMVMVFSGVTVGLLIKNNADNNRLKANEVITMIEMLEGKEITADHEDEINKILEKYDALSKAQKKKVTNKDALDGMVAALEEAKQYTDEDRERDENQVAADEVIRLISTLEGKEVTIDSESEITVIRMQYDALTRAQKDLVSNYSILAKAETDLQNAKDAEAASALVLAIDSIDASSLTGDSTQINMLLNQYDALSDAQKELVTNYNKLLEYKKAVEANATKEAAVKKGTDLAENFPGYSGKWGDFGAHKNAYQGMIETVIRRDAKLREYFECDPDPNYLEMYASRFTKDTSGFGIARCTVTFTGIDKEDGFTSTLHGEVIIKNDGSLYFTINYYN
ncbi:MAG: hypothetical protein IKT46_07280 [Clostridia bacterium]|nr:hypothetical protein [Clostridia bacterium]